MTSDDAGGIDPSVGLQVGEAATQGVAGRDSDEPELRKGSARVATSEGGGYYGRPAIKEPVWIWAVPAYFYAGGAAGAAATIGAIAQIVDPHGFEGLVTRSRRVAAAGTAAGTALLIYDLGRPERFLNMLRVFRPSSPMSVGSWALAGATPLVQASAVLGRSQGALRRIADAAGLAGGVVGAPLAGYTAVLLTTTVVPVWNAVRRSLPFLFVASSVSSAVSLIEIGKLNEREQSVVQRLGLLASVAELVATVAVEREAGRVEGVDQPLKTGLAGALWTAATACTVAGLMLSLIPRTTRSKLVASSLLGTAGSLATRFAFFFAGRESARDPAATLRPQEPRSHPRS
jgi:formate-dependent nitrite reductase membrane component NrfD